MWLIAYQLTGLQASQQTLVTSANTSSAVTGVSAVGRCQM